MPKGRATRILIAVAAIAIVFVGLSSRGSRDDLGRSNTFADYLTLRYDLGDDLRYQQVTAARLAQEQRPAIEQCLTLEDVRFDLDEWDTATRGPAVDAPLLTNPLASSSDVFRPIAPEVVELLGTGLERHAIVIEQRERALSEIAGGDPSDIEAVRSCLGAQEFDDTRPELAQDLDAALLIGLSRVYDTLDGAEPTYATCMDDTDLPTLRSGDFREQIGFLVADYRAAWDDAPVDGRESGPAWLAVREAEIELSLADAECRRTMIGDTWNDLADVLEIFDREFSDERETLVDEWTALLTR